MNKNIDSKPTFIISLDFELHWGMSDIVINKNHPYMENIVGARAAIPKILELFEKYEINATWAIVGFLFCDNNEDAKRYRPEKIPLYENPRVNNWLLDTGLNEKDDPIHFASSLINEIASVKGQEIGSHTFSHYYCYEKGSTLADFNHDLHIARQVGIDKGYNIRSLVLPRNQIDDSYIPSIENSGFYCYRGNLANTGFSKQDVKKVFSKGIRYLDTFFDITGHNCFNVTPVGKDKLLNIPGSRFFRPRSNVPVLNKLKIKRIKKSMYHAAINGECYHLWWHPHNFGLNTESNISDLEDILNYYNKLRYEYDMQSYNMGELAEKYRCL